MGYIILWPVLIFHLGENVNIIKIHTVLDVSKESAVEVNAEKTRTKKMFSAACSETFHWMVKICTRQFIFQTISERQTME
jgi:hypothetical protein